MHSFLSVREKEFHHNRFTRPWLALDPEEATMLLYLVGVPPVSVFRILQQPSTRLSLSLFERKKASISLFELETVPDQLALLV